MRFEFDLFFSAKFYWTLWQVKSIYFNLTIIFSQEYFPYFINFNQYIFDLSLMQLHSYWGNLTVSTKPVKYVTAFLLQGISWSPNSEELWVWLILFIASIFQRDICELTACPRAEQIPCICDELMGQ